MQGLLKRANLKAGGVGLNLTVADTVIHYDPWWHPPSASDRAHRIGQTKPVFVHKLMKLGSIEENMESLKANKRKSGLRSASRAQRLDIDPALHNAGLSMKAIVRQG